MPRPGNSARPKGFHLRELDILSRESDSLHRIRLKDPCAEWGAPIGNESVCPAAAKTRSNLLRNENQAFRFADESHRRGLECRLIREIRSALRGPRSRCARSAHHEDLERDCAASSGDQFDLAAKTKEGAAKGDSRKDASGRWLAVNCRRRNLSGRRELLGPPYQRTKEFTRKGSAPVVAGAAVLSTTTLVPTRARL